MRSHYTRVHYQFSLFGWQKPSKKIPISAARIREAKEEMAIGNTKAAVSKMREVHHGRPVVLSTLNSYTNTHGLELHVLGPLMESIKEWKESIDEMYR